MKIERELKFSLLTLKKPLIKFGEISYLGARINNINVSIIVYADDIILLSPVDSHLQRLLDICDEYSKFWKIKFNAKKSNIIEFGPQFFKNTSFYISNNLITKVYEITYLGAKINNKLNFNEISIEKFKEVQKSVSSFSRTAT